MSKALLKYIRLSPTKARLIAREIQGMNAELALASLEFAPNKAAKVIYKVLASAIANGNYDAQSVVVKSCRIDAGPVLRRMSPRARGRANMIRKPTAHILVEVADPKEIAKAIEAQKAQKAKKESKGESKKALAKVGKKDIVKVEKATKKVSESKKADSPKDSSKSTPKATKNTKDSSQKAKSKADSKAESKEPRAKKSSATAKTTTSEDK